MKQKQLIYHLLLYSDWHFIVLLCTLLGGCAAQSVRLNPEFICIQMTFMLVFTGCVLSGDEITVRKF